MFASDALLLIGHGSARYPDAARVLHVHAAALRGAFKQVEVGLLNGEPSVAAALARIGAPVIRAVPFFMEAGYFTNTAVPRALGADPRVRIAAPVGTHDGLAAVVQRLAERACQAMGAAPGDAAVLLVGHGSAKAPGRALALHRCARLVESANRFARVQAACLEEAPYLPDALALSRDRPAVVVGFFAGEGMHVRDDVPGALAAERTRRQTGLAFAGCVTDDPEVAGIIAERAAAADGAATPLRA